MQKYYRKPGPYKAFKYCNTFYKPKYENSFSKKVSFSNKNYENKFDKYCPTNHVHKNPNYQIKTKNRFEGLIIDDDVLHQDNHDTSYNDVKQSKSKNNFRYKKSKHRKIDANKNHLKDMEELTNHMIEKGPITIKSNKDINCFYVNDLLKEYRKIPIRGKMIYIDGEIAPENHKLPVQFVLDSGSSVSLISGRTMNKLKRLGIYPTKTNKVLVTTHPNETKINEMIELPIDISDGIQTLQLKSQFLVSDHLPFEALIGNNILDRYLDKLDYTNRYAEFRISNTNNMGIPFGNKIRVMRSDVNNYSNPIVLSSWLY